MLCCVALSLESFSARIVSLKEAEELMMGYCLESSADIGVAHRDVTYELIVAAILIFSSMHTCRSYF